MYKRVLSFHPVLYWSQFKNVVPAQVISNNSPRFIGLKDGQMARVALYLQDAHKLHDGLDYVRYAEEQGFEAVWQAESRLVRDAIVPMAAYAAVTSRIKVGSGVINNWSRNIGLLASTFLTLDDLAPNRIICGIGAWWDPLAHDLGIDRKNPLTAMKETVLILRRLLNMERVTYQGNFINVNNIELDIVHGRREPRNIPIMIGATGEKMLELAGEIADGVLLNYFVPPTHNDKALEHLEKGALISGRNITGIDRPQLIVCAVDNNHDIAFDATKKLLCQYLAQQPHFLKESGAPHEVITNIQSVLSWPATKEQINQAKDFIPDDLVSQLTASGTPEEARKKVDEYRSHGTTCPVLYPVDCDVKLLIDTFSEH